MKGILIIGIVVALVVGIFVGSYIGGGSSQIMNLEQENAALEQQISELQAQIEEIEGQINNQDNEIDYSCNEDSDCLLVMKNSCCGCVSSMTEIDLVTAINKNSIDAWKEFLNCDRVVCGQGCPAPANVLFPKCNNNRCEVVGIGGNL